MRAPSRIERSTGSRCLRGGGVQTGSGFGCRAGSGSGAVSGSNSSQSGGSGAWAFSAARRRRVWSSSSIVRRRPSKRSRRSVSSVIPAGSGVVVTRSTRTSTGGGGRSLNGGRVPYDHAVRPRPERLQRLPQQYFVALLGRVAAAAAQEGEPLVDLGRGNPETGPPPHVVEALRAAALEPGVHGYAPIRGLPRTKEAIAARYRDVYGVDARPGDRGRAHPRDEDRDRRARAQPLRRGRHAAAPRSVLPRLPVGRRRSPARGSRRCRCAPTRAGRPTSTRRPPRRRST